MPVDTPDDEWRIAIALGPAETGDQLWAKWIEENGEIADEDFQVDTFRTAEDTKRQYRVRASAASARRETANLASAIDALQDAFENHPGSLKNQDEHDRWSLYERSLDAGVPWQRVGECCILDFEKPVGDAALVKIIEMVKSDERNAVIRLAERVDWPASFVGRRFAELELLDSFLAITGQELGADETDLLANSAKWVQLRVAKRSMSSAVLSELARSGHTKETKRVANSRLKELKK